MRYKDPITGEFKDIYVKASDTLPVGSVVEIYRRVPSAVWI